MLRWTPDWNWSLTIKSKIFSVHNQLCMDENSHGYKIQTLIPLVEQQTDGISCGIFAIHFAETIFQE